jgi:hypothetical protein
LKGFYYVIFSQQLFNFKAQYLPYVTPALTSISGAFARRVCLCLSCDAADSSVSSGKHSVFLVGTLAVFALRQDLDPSILFGRTS